MIKKRIEELLREQENKCVYCGKELDDSYLTTKYGEKACSEKCKEDDAALPF